MNLRQRISAYLIVGGLTITTAPVLTRGNEMSAEHADFSRHSHSIESVFADATISNDSLKNIIDGLVNRRPDPANPRLADNIKRYEFRERLNDLYITYGVVLGSAMMIGGFGLMLYDHSKY